ncbi:hypothetical protein [Leptolyngbya sp. 7M]|uniref:hypothetical protein n=1 Tax=Leptolyngbya sp. 7M TaxID=2812896 RepID=UPI001B8D35D2|nr:hypothetical protein [Leptolyngbya sp. 7M]QYO62665.1 hypothetical protein JVX88_21795 [Leptolyngbya sp. 7M]
MLEERLRDFLLRERMIGHIQRYVELGVNRADTLRQTIAKFKGTLSADQKELIKARESLEPKLAELRRRGQSLDHLIDRYQQEILNVVELEFDAYGNSLAEKLPKLLKQKKLKTLEGGNQAFLALPNHQKKVTDEVKQLFEASLEDLGSELTSRLESRIKAILERMHGEVKDRITELSREYTQLKAQIPGIPLLQESEVYGSAERVLAALAGLLLGDPAGVVFGSALGLRGLLTTLLVQITAWITFLATGSLAVFWIAIPVLLVSVILTGGFGLEDRLKDKAVERFLKLYSYRRSDIDADKEFQKLSSEERKKIYQATKEYQRQELVENIRVELNRKTFEEVRSQVKAYIDEEENIIHQTIEEGLKDEAEKARRLHEFSQLEAKISSARADLKDVLVKVKQLG